MRTVSEKKAFQGYKDKGPTCPSCRHYKSDREVYGTQWGKEFCREKNRRCGLGGFAVKAMGWCVCHAPREGA